MSKLRSRIPVLSVLLSAVFLISCDTLPRSTSSVYKLYFLGGQSNMDGYGYVNELPADLNDQVPQVMIFHGNHSADGEPVDGRGLWAPLRPGHGVGFSSDGDSNAYSDRFGVELTFARRLRELDPESKIALIKYSRGGTSIDSIGEFGCWDPEFVGTNGVNQYDHFFFTVRNAVSVDDIDGDGIRDYLLPSGIVWMQGESDAMYTEAVANRYQDHLTRLMNHIRITFGDVDLPVVVGRISDSGQDESGSVWEHLEIVQRAQQAFVESDPAAFLVTSTDEYQYSDPWHYDTEGFLDLGRQFAEAMAELQGRGGS